MNSHRPPRQAKTTAASAAPARPRQLRHDGDRKRVVVIGGSGLVGSRLVKKLRRAGHATLSAFPGSGVDAITGEGLAEAFEWAEVVVDVSNPHLRHAAAVRRFFETTTRNILAAETAAGVEHHVALSVVGADRLRSPYFRAKLAQEEEIRSSTVPFTILRATQFFESIGRAADRNTDSNDVVRLPPVPLQPEAAADVAAALADIATSEPRNDIVELAGPQSFRPTNSPNASSARKSTPAE